MWLLVHRNAKTRLVAGGRSFLEVCPECGRKARFDEVEITRSYGVFFIDLLDDKERKYRCSACHEVFDLRDESEDANSPRARHACEAVRETERAAADARRAAETDRLREQTRAQAVAEARAAQIRAARARAAEAEAARAKAVRIEDELAELKKRMGR